MGSSVTLEVPLRAKIRSLRGRAVPANHGPPSSRASKAPYACQNCCPRPNVKVAAAIGLARRGPQSLLISSSLLCGRRHLLQRGGRSCPNEARPAPITPLEATGACSWLAWPGSLARQEPGAGVVSYEHPSAYFVLSMVGNRHESQASSRVAYIHARRLSWPTTTC